MQTIDMALLELVRRGLVTNEEAQSKTLTPNLFGRREADGPQRSMSAQG